jgi:hypothetical protein
MTNLERSNSTQGADEEANVQEFSIGHVKLQSHPTEKRKEY